MTALSISALSLGTLLAFMGFAAVAAVMIALGVAACLSPAPGEMA